MITKYPYQFSTERGESVTVYTEDYNEYKFNVVYTNGSTNNFSWFENDKENKATYGQVDAYEADIIADFHKHNL